MGTIIIIIIIAGMEVGLGVGGSMAVVVRIVISGFQRADRWG